MDCCLVSSRNTNATETSGLLLCLSCLLHHFVSNLLLNLRPQARAHADKESHKSGSSSLPSASSVYIAHRSTFSSIPCRVEHLSKMRNLTEHAKSDHREHNVGTQSDSHLAPPYSPQRHLHCFHLQMEFHHHRHRRRWSHDALEYLYVACDDDLAQEQTLSE